MQERWGDSSGDERGGERGGASEVFGERCSGARGSGDRQWGREWCGGGVSAAPTRAPLVLAIGACAGGA